MGKRKVETLILDLDGTLVDARTDIAKAVNYTLGQLGLPELPEDLIASYIGGGAVPILQQSLGDRAEELLEEALGIFKKRYYERCTEYTILYPGVRETLEDFKDKDIAMATNKLVDMTHRILEHFGIDGYFKIVLGPDSVTNRKPHPESIEKILDQLDNPRETALIVGDSHFDIQTGKNAGIMTCGVTYGLGTREELVENGADIIIDRLEDLKLYFE